MRIIDIIQIVKEPKYTSYFWGDISEIAGKPLNVIERNQKSGCCLCVNGKGLIDVDKRDIQIGVNNENK